MPYYDKWLKMTPKRVAGLNDGELVRWTRPGGFREFNSPENCIWLVQWVDANPPTERIAFYSGIVLVRQEHVHSLEEAVAKLRIAELLHDGAAEYTVKDVTGEQFDGNDNDDVYTFIVTSDKGRLTHVIRCNYIGTEKQRKELLSFVAKMHGKALEESGKTDAEIDGEVG